ESRSECVDAITGSSETARSSGRTRTGRSSRSPRETWEVIMSLRSAGPGEPYDVIVIGAGLSGMYQLHRLRELGLSVRVFEAGDHVGGTWYWNRYPGARFDSESWTYGYSFSDEILRDWEWSEHFAAQPETLRYCNFVADKFDLRRDIEFGCRIKAAVYDEATGEWEIESEDGRRARARFLITAIGPLSAPTMPTIPGVESFRGEAYHTGRWPHEPVSFVGKRVAVIGTGATAVQAITEIAKTVGHLTVFQRTPNVRLVDLRETPIERITPAGVKTTDAEYEADMLIYATGFDAITGAFDRIDIRGGGGRRLREKWAEGPRTYLGLQIEGFPNLFTLVGPHNAATFCNIPRCVEQNVDWVTALIRHMREKGHTRVEPTAEAEREWTQHVLDTGRRMLFTQVDSWMMGINSNVAGKQKRTFIVYAGGAPKYREKCDEVAAAAYVGFTFG